MATVEIFFKRMVEQSHSIKSDPGHNQMLTQVFLDLSVDGVHFGEQQVTLHQPYGSEYATEPIEVKPVVGSYSGQSWNHHGFCELVESVYRNAVEQQGQMIRLANGTTAEMANNLIDLGGIACELQISHA